MGQQTQTLPTNHQPERNSPMATLRNTVVDNLMIFAPGGSSGRNRPLECAPIRGPNSVLDVVECKRKRRN
jgi:hypothetical protein